MNALRDESKDTREHRGRAAAAVAAVAAGTCCGRKTTEKQALARTDAYIHLSGNIMNIWVLI